MRGIVGTIIFMVILLAVEIVSLVQGGHHVGWRIATGVAILVVSISNYFVFKDKSW
jgi:predicted Co/Zn/Cd cation transporter (cation efflux family)